MQLWSLLQDELTVVILNPDSNSRARLREVLKGIAHKVALRYAAGPDEVLRQIHSGDVDFAFVAYSLGQAALSEFARGLGGVHKADLPPVIVTVNTKDRQQNVKVAGLYLQGINGFIAEPYSPDDLIKLMSVFAGPCCQRKQAQRTKKAAQFLFADAASQIDQLAKQEAEEGGSGGLALRQLKDLSRKLQELYERDAEGFAAAMIDTFEGCSPPAPGSVKKVARRLSKEAPHPGAVVRDLMKARGLTAYRVLSIIRLDPADLELLLSEQKSVDAYLSRELSRALGKTSAEWMRIQHEHDQQAGAKRS